MQEEKISLFGKMLPANACIMTIVITIGIYWALTKIEPILNVSANERRAAAQMEWETAVNTAKSRGGGCVDGIMRPQLIPPPERLQHERGKNHPRIVMFQREVPLEKLDQLEVRANPRGFAVIFEGDVIGICAGDQH